MPEQLPKEIFNMISDRSTQIKGLNSYAKAIQAVSSPSARLLSFSAASTIAVR